ncbi:hypothetical protein NPIL_273331 [Nephila pilipes]|uniref:Uncharacterized protein n=1 Tax=Nephila pilipes TaxID=299642 RepID=A0A8X6NI74_NEPPI|nr:hypothetical protein NPIL_273331 [Nephila pilipes]
MAVKAATKKCFVSGKGGMVLRYGALLLQCFTAKAAVWLYGRAGVLPRIYGMMARRLQQQGAIKRCSRYGAALRKNGGKVVQQRQQGGVLAALAMACAVALASSCLQRLR